MTWLEAAQLFVPAIVGAVLAWLLRKVHVLVNSRLTAALDEISALKIEVGANRQENMQLRAEIRAHNAKDLGHAHHEGDR